MQTIIPNGTIITDIEKYCDDFGYKYKDILKLELSLSEHSKSKSNILEFSGLMKWSDECADCWGGPYPGNFCIIKVINHENNFDLLTIEQSMANMRKYLKYSKYSYEKHDTLKILDYKSINTMTHQHLQKLEQYNTYAIHKASLDIEKEMIRYFNELKGHATKEYPFRIYMAGNDDFSYSNTYSSLEEAMATVESISKNPTMEHLQKNLKFIFTN